MGSHNNGKDDTKQTLSKGPRGTEHLIPLEYQHPTPSKQNLDFLKDARFDAKEIAQALGVVQAHHRMHIHFHDYLPAQPQKADGDPLIDQLKRVVPQTLSRLGMDTGGLGKSDAAGLTEAHSKGVRSFAANHTGPKGNASTSETAGLTADVAAIVQFLENYQKENPGSVPDKDALTSIMVAKLLPPTTKTRQR